MSWTYEQRGAMWAVMGNTGITIALVTSRVQAAIICHAVGQLSEDDVEAFLRVLHGD